jgi:hypothetical protein
MALINRQNNLFAAEDWKIAYQAFSNVNFQAYDYDTIRQALVTYVQENFPENFNDYIESSEFIAIIEMLAFLSQSLAFRMDLNSRENFLETAERRDSVFKLARMLGYNPKRNIAASGLMKVVGVRTTEPLTDSLNNDLANRLIFWNDANNPNSYEQFITVVNAAMAGTNRFTSPYKQGTVGGIQSELYRISTPLTAPITYNFSADVNSRALNFNVLNPNFIDNGFFYEEAPNPTNLFNLIYRNDGLGLNSTDTGFFVMFKQGLLDFVDLDFTQPIQNRTADVSIPNINETDVYVQQITSGGVVIAQWTQVPNVVGQTLNYNSELFGTRNLYAVENLDNGGVRLRFPDGNFGNVPQGLYRVWYRTSLPERYTMQPADARNITINIPYINRRNQTHALTLTFSLQRSVNNSLPPETLRSIKQRAPQVYYTQNRMVSAQDYNIFPITQSTNITKLKAINRTHAGHSRYIDINDPTGTYQNVDMFAKDAILYSEYSTTTDTVIISDNTTPAEVTAGIVPKLLKTQALNNYVYYGLRNVWKDFSSNKFKVTNLNVRWQPLPQKATSSTGYMTETFSSGTRVVMTNSDTRTAMFKENNFIKFVNSSDLSDYKWVRVVSVANNGALTSGLTTGIGPWQLSDDVPENWFADELIVSLRKLFTASEAQAVQDAIVARQTFGLGYDVSLDTWYVIRSQNLNKDDYNPSTIGDTTGTGADSSWLLLMEYSPIDNTRYRYNVTIRGERYVVQSRDELKFYNIKNVKVVDSTNRSSQDMITFTTLNSAPGTTETYEWFKRGEIFGWRNTSTGAFHVPLAYATGISLKTRDTKWFDINVAWKSNFGLFNPSAGTGTLTEILDAAIGNRFVGEATVNLVTYFDDGTETSLTSNITIANNTGQLSRIPGQIVIPFNNTTFGTNILDANGNITYRNSTSNGTEALVFHGNAVAYSYGTTGTVLDTSIEGRLFLANANVAAQTGNLIYSSLEDNVYHLAGDRFDQYRDQLVVTYTANKERLTQPIDWQVVDVYKYADGYTDPRKVIVAPIDSDGDLVPDRPLQFSEYVDSNDIQVYETYTDFDGYSYDKPVRAAILDYRKESTISVNFTENTISPGSYVMNSALNEIDWLLVKNLEAAQVLENTTGSLVGLKVYAEEENQTYLMTQESTNLALVYLVETTDFFVRTGRGPTQNTLAPIASIEDSIILWKHVAPKDVRIDPSISNVVEMIVLSTSYFDLVSEWRAGGGTSSFPVEPTSAELSNEFVGLNDYKCASDTLVFRSAKFKLLFGSLAEPEVQAKFRVVKLSNQISDNELKTQILFAMNDYFDINNWEFGETFYFTELSSYIHQQLGSSIGSIVILPRNTSGNFGNLFQVKAEPNELFMHVATVDDIEIVEKITSQTLRTDR